MDTPAELSPQQRAELIALLDAARADVEADMAGSAGDDKPVDLGLAIGRLSRVDALQQQQMAAARRRRLDVRLAQIKAARARASAGEYGDCVTCGGPIGYARLKVKPEAPFCRACQAGSGD